MKKKSEQSQLKIDNNYRRTMRNSRRCTRCKHSKFDGCSRYYCGLVADNVTRYYTCDKFEEKARKARDK